MLKTFQFCAVVKRHRIPSTPTIVYTILLLFIFARIQYVLHRHDYLTAADFEMLTSKLIC